MSSAAHTYHGTPIDSPLIDVITLPHLLHFLSQFHQQDQAITFYAQEAKQYTLTYQQLLAEVQSLQQILRQKFSIQMGDRVSTLCPNCPDVIVFNLAAMSLGAIVVPLNPAESAESINYILNHSGARLLVYDYTIKDQVTALQPDQAQLQTCPLSDLTRPHQAALTSSKLAHWPAPDPTFSHLTPAVILYTSGTTGRPKGVVLSHYNLLVNAEALKRVHRLAQNLVHMCVLPLFHANAWGFSQIATFYVGGHLVLNDAAPLLSFWRILRQEKVNICSLIPQVIARLCRRPATRESLPHLHHVVSAAAPLSTALAQEFYQKTQIPIHQGYGLSECTNFATTIPYDVAEETYDAMMHGQATPSIGSSVFGSQVAVVGDNGRLLAAGTPGEVVVQGHANMSGYWQDEAATQQALGDGHLHTGDQGYYLTDGGQDYFFITGRIKEIIIRIGKNISPTALERELTAWQALGEFAVLGFVNDAVGEEVGLYLHGTDLEAVTAEAERLLRLLPFFRRPKVVLVGKRPLPRTSTGKVQRSRLTPYFHAYQSHTFREGVKPIVALAGITE